MSDPIERAVKKAVEEMFWAEPQRVTVVRPHRTPAETVSRMIAVYGMTLLYAWFVMLLLPVSPFGVEPGYWSCVALMFVVRLVFGAKDHSFQWTTSKRDILASARRRR